MSLLRFALAAPLLLFAIGCERGAPVAEIRPAASEARETPDVVATEDDWPWWRGPWRNAKAVGPAPPLRWSASENVAWSVEVPGRGHASPTLWGDRIFVSTAEDEGQVQLLMCYQRSDGALLWQAELFRGGFMGKHTKNSHASATPAADGERVFVPFIANGSLWTTAVDFDGKTLWQKESGKFKSQHGYGASPVIYRSLVIVSGDNDGPGYLTAHDRETGEIVWRTARGAEPSYGTPIVAHTGGRDRLLISGQGDVASYDPQTGERHWRASGPASVTGNTLAWSDELVFASGGYPTEMVLALRAADGEQQWRQDFKVYVTSPLEHEGRLYLAQDSGVMRCLESKTGREIWKGRLGGNFTASPTLWQDRIYVPNEDGTTFVLRAADRFEILAENALGDAAYASPVICDGQIYLRTETRLWRLGGDAND